MPKGTPAKKNTPIKEILHAEKLPKDWDYLPGEKVTPFTLPEQTIADDKDTVYIPSIDFSPPKEPSTWTEKTFSAQVDRDELERLLGGEFEDVAGEPSRRSNHKFETYSDGVDCYCYQCPRGSKPPVVARTWADVATRMGV